MSYANQNYPRYGRRRATSPNNPALVPLVLGAAAVFLLVVVVAVREFSASGGPPSHPTKPAPVALYQASTPADEPSRQAMAPPAMFSQKEAPPDTNPKKELPPPLHPASSTGERAPHPHQADNRPPLPRAIPLPPPSEPQPTEARFDNFLCSAPTAYFRGAQGHFAKADFVYEAQISKVGEVYTNAEGEPVCDVELTIGKVLKRGQDAPWQTMTLYAVRDLANDLRLPDGVPVGKQYVVFIKGNGNETSYFMLTKRDYETVEPEATGSAAGEKAGG